MDRFEKWAEYIMKHGDKIIEEKKHRNMLIRRVSFSCASAFAAIIIVFFAWKSAPPKIEIPSDNIISESSTVTNSTYTENTAPTTTSFTNTRYTSITNINKTLTTTVTTVPITTKTSIIQKTTSVTATTKSVSTTYAVTEAYTQTVTTKAARPVTTRVQTASVTTSVVTVTAAVTTQTNNGSNMGGFGGDDMSVRTLPQTYTTVSSTTTSNVTTSVTTTTTNGSANDKPPQPMNEKFPLGFLEGDMTMYRNTYRISPDNVGEYIGIAGMRAPLEPIYDAKAFKINNIEVSVAIAVKFEEDEEYYLYRNNDTTVDTIKKLISPEE